jgi:hypothetical protein
MNDNLDLKTTERASFKLAGHADGTADISLGLVFMLLGIFPLTRAALGPSWNMIFYLAMLGIIVFTQTRVRARLVPERIGVVKFGPHVRRRKIVFLLITILLAAAMIATWVGSARGWSPDFPDWFANYGFEILVALIVLGIFWAIAYTMSLRRYYIYGVLLAAGFPIQSLLTGSYEGAPFLVAGLIITVSGAFLMNRFLKAYPVVNAEAGVGDD